jgi:hypothetical protein
MTKVVTYNNDDPFWQSRSEGTPRPNRFLWRWYLRQIKFAQFNFFYRPVNVNEALKSGAKNPELLMPYFLPERDRPIELSPKELENLRSDVIFIGHYEPDHRSEFLAELKQAGINVSLHGGSEWKRSQFPDFNSLFPDIKPAYGLQYVRLLSASKVCLAFLSKLNRDVYTRRCFEIPAIGKLLLAERTQELRNLFLENEEACFFESKEELLERVTWLLENPSEIKRISQNGLNRVWRDGHDVYSRAEEFLKSLDLQGKAQFINDK